MSDTSAAGAGNGAGGIDVVVPTYQYGRYLRGAVTSITSQDVPGIRVLIVDNASTDETSDVAAELVDQDPRITYVRHRKNLGMFASYNEGVDWARSEFFHLVDADDRLAPGALRRAIGIMYAHPDVAFTWGVEANVFGDDRDLARSWEESEVGTESWEVTPGPDFVGMMCRRGENIVGNNTIVRRTEAQRAAGYYNDRLPHTADLEMCLRLALQGRVARTDRVQAIRTRHPQQHTVMFVESFLHGLQALDEAFVEFFEGAGSVLPERDEMATVARESVAARAYRSWLVQLARGRRDAAAPLGEFWRDRCPRYRYRPPLAAIARGHDFGSRLVDTERAVWRRAADTFSLQR